MIVWAFKYGTPENTIEFSHQEAARLVKRTNCAEDVQTYKNGLSRVYSGPVRYLSFTFIFRQIGGTATRVAALAALRVPVKIYTRYGIDASVYYWANVIPERENMFVAGHQSAADLVLKFIETTEPASQVVIPGLLYFPFGGLYGNVG